MLTLPFGSTETEGCWMAFLFRLETADGAAADPTRFETAVHNWRAGDTIPIGKRTLRVVGRPRRRRGPTAAAEVVEVEQGDSRYVETVNRVVEYGLAYHAEAVSRFVVAHLGDAVDVTEEGVSREGIT
jgi:hypothetical protein